MALPFLPGNSFNPNLGKTKYHLSHHFDIQNETKLMVGEEKPGVGGVPIRGQKMKPRNSYIPPGMGSHQPAWVAFDKQVLSFDAYFQEAVHEKREEQYRVRNCKIYFYLEDDSIQVNEPRIKNAGVPQGTIIRRHRITKPAPYDDEFYTVEDFNVGNEITFYGRTFKMTDCDEFTRNFLRKLGVRVQCPEAIPDDPYSSHRKALDESMQPLRPYEKYDTLKQFLDHDRHVLRFFCFWDDTESMFGDKRDLVLHYFLADDTIEIREVIPPNAGRDAVPTFLRRGQLPKSVEDLKQPGVATDRTVLNVFGPTGHGGRYILDSLKTGAAHVDYYKESDLTIGTILNVWGRKVVLCDCDDFTKEYYRTKFGINDFTPIRTKSSECRSAQREAPPYNGFGSEEDSLCSCAGLLPKPPKRDFIKFMEKDRHGLDSHVLRFLAKLDTDKPTDVDRRFIVSYYLSDDSIQVFEPQVRNSGIIGGKFLERDRIKKPEQPAYSTQNSEYYQSHDLYIGALVEFHKHRFVIIDADDYAYNFMERHPEVFSQSNIQSIMGKLGSLQLDMTGGSGVMGVDSFRETIRGASQGALNEHEIMTLARFYQDRQDDGTSAQQLIALAQENLRKGNFEDFARLADQCSHMDSSQNGLLDPESLRAACRSAKVPLPADLIRNLIDNLPKNGEGLVPYDELVNQLNWRDKPVAQMQNAPPSRPDEAWQGNTAANQLQTVNVSAFTQDLQGGARGNCGY